LQTATIEYWIEKTHNKFVRGNKLDQCGLIIDSSFGVKQTHYNKFFEDIDYVKADVKRL
jgi:hypothetical protein